VIRLFISILIALPLVSKSISIDNFITDIYSKSSNSLKKVEVSLIYDTNSTKTLPRVRDALNIVISSFYVEDLFTSKNKERFKLLLKEYISKKHSIEIYNIYIQNMQLKENLNIDELIQALKRDGLINKK
jgi:hypothetical protein